jgi:hypothetical protein
VGLSHIHSRLRVLQAGGPSSAGSSPRLWHPPDSFDRKTTKYWVRPDKVMLLKVLVVRHLPVLLFDKKADTVLQTPQIKSARDSGLITSVYFDADDQRVYANRLAREEGATLIRFRWYGLRTPICNLFLERKTHHEAWVEELSVKERLAIQEKDVPGFLTGALRIDEGYLVSKMGKAPGSDMSKNVKLAGEIQDEILSRGLKPKLRTSYNRTAFQLSTNNDVRISLDTELTLSRDWTSASGWCRPDNLRIGPEDIAECQYAVLEVKLGVEEPPEWVESVLLETGALLMHKFSKFLHATSSLYPVPELPSWFDDEYARNFVRSIGPRGAVIGGDDGEDMLVTEQQADRRGRELAARAAGGVIEVVRAEPAPPATNRGTGGGGGGAGGGGASGGDGSGALPPEPPLVFKSNAAGGGKLAARPQVGSAAQKVPVRTRPLKIEPKTYFANERTLISWINVLILLAITSLSSLAYGKSNGSRIGIACGGSLCVVTVFFGYYALYVFYRRLNALARGHLIRFDDPYGPPALVLCLTTVLAVTVLITINNNKGSV